jgi:prepilin-type N-terminal cleavage/methylation domain-containing protein
MQLKHPRGFSLIELMVVITVIGILAMLASPRVMAAARRAEATTTANDIRVFTNAIEFYSTSEGAYPGIMSYSWMPESIEGYLPHSWTDGTYSWFYANNGTLTYILVYNLDFTPEQSIRLDSIIDDGNIATGKMIIGPGGTGLLYAF